jgi:hypothetical protein
MTDDFTEAVSRHLIPVLAPMGFRSSIHVSGRLYAAEFSTPTHVVSISFEPGDDYWLVVVFTVNDGVQSEIDDPKTTPRLADLNAKYLTTEDGLRLKALRQTPLGDNHIARKMQRIAAELAVVLPRYMAEGSTR